MAALYLPIRAISRSQNVRVGGQRILPTQTYYVDINDGRTLQDLHHHQAIGAIIVVGSLTANNSDYVVLSGGLVTAGAGLTVNVSAGEFQNRATDAVIAGLAGTNVALTVAHATLNRKDLVVWDGVSGVAAKVDGTAAATPVAPATPAGKVQLATVLVNATVVVPGTITDVRNRP